MSFEGAIASHQVPREIQERYRGSDPFEEQYQACQRALDVLAAELTAAAPDVTIVVSDDQDEWFYENNMPPFAVYWGDSVPLVPRRSNPGGRSPEIAEAIAAGYGDVCLDVPVPAQFGRFLIEELMAREFDIAQMTYLDDEYGGDVTRRYPSPEGEVQILHSATSESLNWVTAAGALQATPLKMELVDYVPVYRTEAGTGGGWAFALWR